MPASIQKLALSAALLLAIMLSARAQSTKHAHVELLSRDTAAVPGKKLLLGVHFRLDPGWHIYWVNPGDSGQPPSFDWQLPAGWSAGEIHWPRPERMQSSPTLADYGYHDDVLLMVPVKVAARQKRGEAQEIRVNAKWLICSEECIPEKAQLSLKMGVATHADRSAEAPLFATAEELVPKPVPATWKTSVDVNSEDFILTVDMGGRESHAEYFAYEYGQIDYSAPQSMRSTANGFRLAVRKSPLKVKLTGFLWGVLVIPGRGAWVLNVPYGRPVKMKN